MRHIALQLLAAAAATLLGNPVLLYAAPPAAGAGRACTREQEAANRKVVEVANSSPSELAKAMHPDYIQHNPEMMRFAELNGLNSAEATERLSKLTFGGRPPPPPASDPGQPRDNNNYSIIAQCDMVVVVGEHWHPYPDNPSRYYATYFFNMWRIKDGKLYEHWDPKDMPVPFPEFLKAPLKDLNAVPAAGSPTRAE
jgi:predicted SnoaL-like aldol condensation-catalyzing enzyme